MGLLAFDQLQRGAVGVVGEHQPDLAAGGERAREPLAPHRAAVLGHPRMVASRSVTITPRRWNPHSVTLAGGAPVGAGSFHSSRSIAPPSKPRGSEQDPRVPPRAVEPERVAGLGLFARGAHTVGEPERVDVEPARPLERRAVDVHMEQGARR